MQQNLDAVIINPKTFVPMAMNHCPRLSDRSNCRAVSHPTIEAS